MGIISYKPLIDDMTWSYSRIEAFNDCPYRFFLRYIKRFKEDDKFYSSYGSFIHKILERYYKGELTKDEMLTTFLLDFKKEVRGIRPKESTVQKYINAGCEYLKSFSPFPYKLSPYPFFLQKLSLKTKKQRQIHINTCKIFSNVHQEIHEAWKVPNFVHY